MNNRSNNLTPLSESAVIDLARKLRHPAASRIIKGIGDDCAVVRAPGNSAFLITTDVMTESVHFLVDICPPESVGAKLLAVNLSDIAAMGGRPEDAVVSLMLPANTGLEWVERFFAGLGDVARKYGVNLVGGDVSRHPDRITLSLTLTGHARRDEVVYRSRARVDDLLYVSGTLGNASAGLNILQRKNHSSLVPEYQEFLTRCYLTPEPRVELGRLLVRTRTATSMIDLSDGIAVGARQLADASSVGIEIDYDSVPVSAALKEYSRLHKQKPVDFALSAGGDYELLLTVPPSMARRVERFGLKRTNLPQLTRIGKIIDKTGVLLRKDNDCLPLPAGGWEHFKNIKG